MLPEGNENEVSRQYAKDECVAARQVQPNPNAWRPPTLFEQAEKSAAHHSEQAQKHTEAAQFFTAHPEFDHFIQLVRKGAIQF